jgi:hypothetical protein
VVLEQHGLRFPIHCANGRASFAEFVTQCVTFRDRRKFRIEEISGP